MTQDTTISDRVAEVRDGSLALIEGCQSLDALQKQRVRLLGKSGEITLLLRSLRDVPANERPAVGKAINDAKQRVKQALDHRMINLQASPNASDGPTADVTLPGIRRALGHRHPLLSTMEQVKSILVGMGYRYDDYPEIEDEFHNFDALNTPKWHPSRDMHDSFFTDSGAVMRTHTTAFQIRAMKVLGQPPIRAMTSGWCYRRDDIDSTHFPTFHQVDVIAIDRQLSFADLKWTLQTMLGRLFGPDISLRFRPSYFPFTTPSAEVDVRYRGRWLELLGSGMIRPEVLRHGGLDPQHWQGFAFGMGIDRVTMARYNIDDIRLIYENEEAFLTQF